MIRKIFHIVLALLLLVATTGVTLHKHYCKGKVKTIAIFEEVDTCFETKESKHDNCFSTCCETKTEELKIKDLEAKKNTFSYDFSPKVHLSVLSYSQSVLNRSPLTSAFSHQYYKHPLLVFDIPIKIQSFLL